MSTPRLTLQAFQIVLLVPAGLSHAEYEAMQQPLDKAMFRRLLRRAAARLCRRFPELVQVTVRVTR